jgi:hypothetical protein
MEDPPAEGRVDKTYFSANETADVGTDKITLQVSPLNQEQPPMQR